MADPLAAGASAARKWFFDSAAVLKAVAVAERRVLSRFGAFVRTRARTSLKYPSAKAAAGGPPASRPGRPPLVHRTVLRRKANRKTGAVTPTRVSPLREFLYFAFDPARRAVVVGPAKVGGVSGKAPKTLEFGGHTPGRFPKPQAARPFMGPALAAERPRFAQLFKDQFR